MEEEGGEGDQIGSGNNGVVVQEETASVVQEEADKEEGEHSDVADEVNHDSAAASNISELDDKMDGVAPVDAILEAEGGEGVPTDIGNNGVAKGDATEVQEEAAPVVVGVVEGHSNNHGTPSSSTDDIWKKIGPSIAHEWLIQSKNDFDYNTGNAQNERGIKIEMTLMIIH